MNNIEPPHTDFIEDTLTNRPNIEDKFISYSKKDREQLKTIIAEHKQALEEHKALLSIDCYNDFVDIYNWLILLLDNKVI